MNSHRSVHIEVAISKAINRCVHWKELVTHVEPHGGSQLHALVLQVADHTPMSTAGDALCQHGSDLHPRLIMPSLWSNAR